MYLNNMNEAFHWNGMKVVKELKPDPDFVIGPTTKDPDMKLGYKVIKDFFNKYTKTPEFNTELKKQNCSISIRPLAANKIGADKNDPDGIETYVLKIKHKLVKPMVRNEMYDFKNDESYDIALKAINDCRAKCKAIIPSPVTMTVIQADKDKHDSITSAVIIQKWYRAPNKIMNEAWHLGKMNKGNLALLPKGYIDDEVNFTYKLLFKFSKIWIKQPENKKIMQGLRIKCFPYKIHTTKQSLGDNPTPIRAGSDFATIESKQNKPGYCEDINLSEISAYKVATKLVVDFKKSCASKLKRGVDIYVTSGTSSKDNNNASHSEMAHIIIDAKMKKSLEE